MYPLYSKEPKLLDKGCKDFESSLGDLAQGYKTLFMLNSTEREISTALKH